MRAGFCCLLNLLSYVVAQFFFNYSAGFGVQHHFAAEFGSGEFKLIFIQAVVHIEFYFVEAGVGIFFGNYCLCVSCAQYNISAAKMVRASILYSFTDWVSLLISTS